MPEDDSHASSHTRTWPTYNKEKWRDIYVEAFPGPAEVVRLLKGRTQWKREMREHCAQRLQLSDGACSPQRSINPRGSSDSRARPS